MRNPRKAVGIGLVVIFLILAVVTTVNARGVFIENIGGFDSDLVNRVRPMLTAWIETTGHSPTRSRDNADYMIRFSVISADASRPFNWWFFLFPVWPIVPLVPVEAEVVVSITIITADGREVYSNTAGGEASRWLFGDFYSRKWAKRKAFEQAFQRVVVSAYLP